MLSSLDQARNGQNTPVQESNLEQPRFPFKTEQDGCLRSRFIHEHHHLFPPRCNRRQRQRPPRLILLTLVHIPCPPSPRRLPKRLVRPIMRRVAILLLRQKARPGQPIPRRQRMHTRHRPPIRPLPPILPHHQIHLPHPPRHLLTILPPRRIPDHHLLPLPHPPPRHPPQHHRRHPMTPIRTPCPITRPPRRPIHRKHLIKQHPHPQPPPSPPPKNPPSSKPPPAAIPPSPPASPAADTPTSAASSRPSA